MFTDSLPGAAVPSMRHDMHTWVTTCYTSNTTNRDYGYLIVDFGPQKKQLSLRCNDKDEKRHTMAQYYNEYWSRYPSHRLCIFSF